MLYFHNLQRARFLKQQIQNITIKVQMFQNNFIKFKSSKMFKLKNVDAQSTSTRSMTFKNSNKTVIDTLLSQIFYHLSSRLLSSKR